MKPTCSQFLRWGERFLEGSLDSSERLGFVQHLRICSLCVEEVAASRRVEEGLRALGRPRAAALSAEGARAILDRSARRGAPPVRVWAAAAALLVCVGIGWRQWGTGGPADLPPDAPAPEAPAGWRSHLALLAGEAPRATMAVGRAWRAVRGGDEARETPLDRVEGALQVADEAWWKTLGWACRMTGEADVVILAAVGR
ncbi:MAG: hypothetical protein HY608_11125 [Planctomycetes bacterium]|nr:hypothetical protein [Planctomycetota bacterium]